MFVRGSGSGEEYRRSDISFYKGIVVKNNDPLKLNRVKIYIPELSNQPNEDWFNEFDEIFVKQPGENNETDNWRDVDIFETIAEHIPWAEPMYPIMGESGNSRYYKEDEISTVSDCNYPEGFEIINENPPSLSAGSYSPAFLYENNGTTLGDAFANPLSNFTLNCNPYSFQYKPDKNVNKSKGLFAIPEVGSKVWMFHYMGDMNFPVYCGVVKDFRELTLINKTDNPSKESTTYPNEFEN